MSIFALGLGMLALTSCDSKKAEPAAPAKPAEEEVIKDSLTQQKVAGEYKSLDQKTVIKLNSDFTASTKNYTKEYTKWAFETKPTVTQFNIQLIRKGMDSDIKEEALLDLDEGKIVVNNETFRKSK